MPSRLTVIKIGGSLLRDRIGLEHAAAVVAGRRREGESLLVVVSALYGVTDLLERAAREALDARLNGARDRMLRSLRERHETIAHQLDSDALARIRGPLDEAEGLIASIRSSGDVPETLYSRLLSSGERLSVPLVAAAIRAQGYDACGMTAEEMGLKAGGDLSAGRCDLAASAEGFRRVRRILGERVVVLTGFYGLDPRGNVVLFGRGGSDDTAGAVAAGLDADRLELWKDVSGFMTADPRHVEAARVVPELSFDEVAQLSEFGSRIVHHGSLEPLRDKPTEIRICALGGESAQGTRLTANRRKNGTQVAALTARKGRALFRLRLRDEAERQLAGSIQQRLNDEKISLATITSSEEEICFTVLDSEVRRVRSTLQDLVEGRLTHQELSPLVAVVGDGVANEGAIGDRMRDCLTRSSIRDVREVRAAGHAGLSCVIHSDDLIPALNELHQDFFRYGRPRSGTAGRAAP